MAYVLVVDDEEGIRRTFPVILEEAGHQVAVAENVAAARSLLQQGDFDVVLTDIVMPGDGGLVLAEEVRREQPDASVVLLTGQPTLETAAQALRLRAHDYLVKPIRGEVLRRVVHHAAEQARLRKENRRLRQQQERHLVELEERVAERTRQLRETLEVQVQMLDRVRRMRDSTAEALSRAMGLRDPYTSTHQRRVTNLALEVWRHLGWDPEKIPFLRIGGLLHDLGKLVVPVEILTKPARLTKTEFEMVQRHSVAGFEVLESLDFAGPVAQIVRQHHERLDGSGYPDHLVGEQILPEARVLGVADVVEAMASHRPYRPALGIEAALAEIRQGAGRLYDPEVVEATQAVLQNGFQWGAADTMSSLPPWPPGD